MPARTLSTLLTCLFMLLAFAGQAVARDLPVWRIGIVVDGPWKREQHRLEVMKNEILALTSGEFDVRFPEDKILHGNWELAGVNRAINQLLRDPEVDLVLALGVVASAEIARRKNLPKPVMAPMIVGLQPSLPYKNGVSGVHNLNYLYAFNKAPSDVLLLHDLYPFKRLAILMEPLTRRVIQRYELDKLFRQIPTSEQYLIGAEGTPEEIVASIPDDADAVMLAPLLRLSREQVTELAELLIERKLPSISIFGGFEVEAGLLAATTTERDIQRLVRRIALNLQRIMLGEDPATIGVEFQETVRPIINMRTAHRLGLSPTYDLMSSAELIGDPDAVEPEPMTFNEAVARAIEHNLSLAVSQRTLAADGEDISVARSNLLPQLDVSLDGREIDEDRAEASNGNAAHYQSSASLELNQLVYSERALANLRIQKLLQAGRALEHEASVLDVVLDTTTAYLDLLRALELARIRNDDLAFTKSNLERARTRVQLGAANRAEVHRWESQLATARSLLIEANVSVSQARVALSRLVNKPLETRFDTTSPSLSDPYFLVSDKRFLRYISTPASVRVLREYMVQEGLRNAPELERLQLAIEAQERAVESARNVYTHPVIGFGGKITEILSRGGAGTKPNPVEIPGFPPFQPENPANDNTDWQIGFSAELPLYAGGGRSAEVRRAVQELASLKYQRDNAMQGIETGIRVNLYGAGGAFANIQYARDRHEAARSNLEMVTDAYGRGAVDIIDLLDAQNAAVTAESAASNAVYDFLIQFMNLERAMGRFDFLMTEEERQDWYRRMETFFVERGVRPAPRSEF